MVIKTIYAHCAGHKTSVLLLTSQPFHATITMRPKHHATMPTCHHANMEHNGSTEEKVLVSRGSAHKTCHHITILYYKIPWHYATMPPCCNATMPLCRDANMPPCHHVTMPPYSHGNIMIKVVVKSHDITIPSYKISCHYATMPPCHHATILPYHHANM